LSTVFPGFNIFFDGLTFNFCFGMYLASFFFFFFFCAGLASFSCGLVFYRVVLPPPRTPPDAFLNTKAFPLAHSPVEVCMGGLDVGSLWWFPVSPPQYPAFSGMFLFIGPWFPFISPPRASFCLGRPYLWGLNTDKAASFPSCFGAPFHPRSFLFTQA